MSVQFDLFIHSSDVIAENDLREAIRQRDVDKAKRKLEELVEHSPEHKLSEPAKAMIEALGAVHPRDRIMARAHLNKLEQQWVPAAKAIFSSEARTLLASLWRASGQALEGMVFEPDDPGCHSSRAYMECDDWKAVIRVVQAEAGFKSQPVLLERLADALWKTDQGLQAVEHWFTLCWLVPEYFEKLIDNGRIPATFLLEHWDEAGAVDVEPRISVEWYPAWVLLQQRGLARSLENTGAETGPQRAFDLVRELMSGGDEQLALRRELRDIHPGLFHCFLQNPVRFSQV